MQDEEMFHPDKEVEERPRKSMIRTRNFKGDYKSLQQNVVKGTKVEVIWNERSEGRSKIVVQFAQGLSDKTATTLRRIRFVTPRGMLLQQTFLSLVTTSLSRME